MLIKENLLKKTIKGRGRLIGGTERLRRPKGGIQRVKKAGFLIPLSNIIETFQVFGNFFLSILGITKPAAPLQKLKSISIVAKSKSLLKWPPLSFFKAMLKHLVYSFSLIFLLFATVELLLKKKKSKFYE